MPSLLELLEDFKTLGDAEKKAQLERVLSAIKSQSPNELFGLTAESVTTDLVKKEYRKIILRIHPDKVPINCKKLANQVFLFVEDIRETLLNPVSAAGAATAGAAASASSAGNERAYYASSDARRYKPKVDETYLREHRESKNLVDVNLSGFDLRDAYLVKANLFIANLKEANLFGVNLIEANLSGADLVRANLSGANLIGANLSVANLIGANLSEADLRGADLGGANLFKANLSGVNLAGANLSSTDLSEADLRDVDFSVVADVTGINLRRVKLTRDQVCQLYAKGYRDFQYVDLRGVDLSGIDLSGVDLRGASVAETDFRGAKLQGVIVNLDELTTAYIDEETLFVGSTRMQQEKFDAVFRVVYRVLREAEISFFPSKTDFISSLSEAASVKNVLKILHHAKVRPASREASVCQLLRECSTRDDLSNKICEIANKGSWRPRFFSADDSVRAKLSAVSDLETSLLTFKLR